MDKISELFKWFGYLVLASVAVGLFFLLMSVGAVLVTIIGFILVVFFVAFLIKETVAGSKRKGPN